MNGEERRRGEARVGKQGERREGSQEASAEASGEAAAEREAKESNSDPTPTMGALPWLLSHLFGPFCYVVASVFPATAGSLVALVAALADGPLSHV